MLMNTWCTEEEDLANKIFLSGEFMCEAEEISQLFVFSDILTSPRAENP